MSACARRLAKNLMSLAVAMLAGCGAASGIPGLGGKNGAAIGIDYPSGGAVIESSSVWMRVHTTGVKLAADSAGNPSPSGDGSYHVYLDGNAIGESTRPAFLVSGMLPGSHTLGVRLFGIDGTPMPGTASSTVQLTVPVDAPRVRIASPGNGAIVNSSSVELSLSWENYTASAWDAFVDDMSNPVAAAATDPTWVVSRLAPGDHDVFVRLLWGPDDPVDPPVLDKVRVHIPPSALEIRITAPLSGATVTRSPTLTVTTKNFTIDGDMAGGPPQNGIGHYHVYLDGYDASHMWQEGYQTTITLDHLDIGEHDLYVRLMNNDHTSIEPKVVDWVHLTVTP